MVFAGAGAGAGAGAVRGPVLAAVFDGAATAGSAFVEAAAAAVAVGVGFGAATVAAAVADDAGTGDVDAEALASGLSRDNTSTSTRIAPMASVETTPKSRCSDVAGFAGDGGAMKFGRDADVSTGPTPGIEASVRGPRSTGRDVCP